jgi:CRP-like cAMP-binding protein
VGATHVSAGQSLLRQGAPADAFFVIDRGRASVKRDDQQIADLGPGDFFGELGLLRGGERTASVVAATDMRVPRHPTAQVRPRDADAPDIGAVRPRRGRGAAPRAAFHARTAGRWLSR